MYIYIHSEISTCRYSASEFNKFPQIIFDQGNLSTGNTFLFRNTESLNS